MRNTLKSRKAAALLLGLSVFLAACESKEEKAARAQEKQQVAEDKKAAAEKVEVDKLFTGVKRTSVDLSGPVLAQLRAAQPAQSIVFEDETPEATAAGDGAVSACSKEVAQAMRREHCFGKVISAQGAVGQVFDEGFELQVKGIGLGVRTTPQQGTFKTGDAVAVRGRASEGEAQDYVFLNEPAIEKLVVPASPVQQRIETARTLAKLCFAAGTLSSTADWPADVLPGDIGEVATDNDDPQGGTVTVTAFGQKINGEMVPHLRRCAIRNGKVVGEQVRAGHIADRKAVLVNAADPWESEKILTERIAKANDTQWRTEQAAYREREKANTVIENELRAIQRKIYNAPDSTERSVALADCMIAQNKAEHGADWTEARNFCQRAANTVPGI